MYVWIRKRHWRNEGREKPPLAIQAEGSAAAATTAVRYLPVAGSMARYAATLEYRSPYARPTPQGVAIHVVQSPPPHPHTLTVSGYRDVWDVAGAVLMCILLNLSKGTALFEHEGGAACSGEDCCECDG